ncbi:hypothetical protein, partial [Ideonella sp.]|uniref:hypothetical protein n=1 Tax=Ideonella sp. TaxID=1929293 RepID=UPI003BB804BB
MTPADSTTPVSLRAAQPYDHAAVQALLKGHGWPVRSRAGWDWAFSHNPARLATAAPLGWVLVQGDSLVGYLGNLPQTFSWRGETVRGATCTSYLVLPEHRSHSLGLMRAFFSQPEVQLFYTSKANGYSGPVYKLFKAKPWA